MTPWWRRRTVVLTAGCLIALITFGARTSFGLFTEPLSDLRDWDRETFALAIAVQNLLWGLGQPFGGAIADRYGPGRVLAAGGAIYALGVVLMSVSTSGTTLALTAGVLVGLGLSGGSYDRHRRVRPPRPRGSPLLGDGSRHGHGLARPVRVRARRPGLHRRVRPRDRAGAHRRPRGARVAVDGAAHLRADRLWWLSIVLGLAAAIVHLPISERPRVAASPA